MEDTSNTHLLDQWLPTGISNEIAKTEPKRFHALAETIKNHWDDGKGGAWSTLPYVSIVRTFLNTKRKFDHSDIMKITNVGINLLLSSPRELIPQIKWCTLLSIILRKYRRTLPLIINWRPLYNLLLEVHFRSRSTFKGIFVYQTHLSVLLDFIRKARRYFPKGSAAEIWNEFRPALENTYRNTAFEALGFLSLFLPTTSPRDLDHGVDVTAEWSKWIPEAISHWQAIPNCYFWDQHWASIIARAAKHLPKAAVHWDAHMADLFTLFLSAFELPVGNSQGSSPVERSTPKSISGVFSSGVDLSRMRSFAKTIVYLSGIGSGSSSVLSRTEALADILEQYYHPSNGGKWTRSLQRFLDNFYHYFASRVSKEKQGLRTPELGFLEPLEPSGKDRIIRCLMRIIEKAQYSKNGKLSETASTILPKLVYFSPSIVLPSVVEGFRLALETETATHQLGSALLAMAGSVRPILLASRAFESGEDLGGTDHFKALISTGGEIVAEAMAATLPGVDANDIKKTTNTFELYLAVLSSVGVIGEVEDGGSGILPVDWSTWTEEILSRIFALLRHLSADSAMGGASREDDTFGNFTGIFFSRMTLPLFKQAVQKLSLFVQSTVLPGGTEQLSQLCMAAIAAQPDIATSALVVPIAEKVISLLGEDDGDKGGELGVNWEKEWGIDLENKESTVPQLSGGLEKSAAHYVSLLASCVGVWGPQAVPHKNIIMKALSASLRANSKKVNKASGMLLSQLIGSLLFYYPVDQFRFSPDLTNSSGIEPWIPTRVSSNEELPAVTTPLWHIPSQEELNLAEDLVQIHFEGALNDLEHLCKVPPQLHKEKWRITLLRILSSLEGLKTSLPDFATSVPPGNDTEAVRLGILGKSGVPLGKVGLREKAAVSVHLACRHLLTHHSDNTDALCQLAVIIAELANYGAREYTLATLCLTSNDDFSAVFYEPIGGAISGSSKLKTRPKWLILERLHIHLIWRASQANYRPCYSGDFFPPPPPGLTLLVEDLAELSLYKYSSVQSFARRALEKALNRFPSLSKSTFSAVMAAISKGTHGEEGAEGASEALGMKPLIRHYTQNSVDALGDFMQGMQQSTSFQSEKTRASIQGLFSGFCLRFAGIPLKPAQSRSETLTLLFQEIYSAADLNGASSTHWKYVLMSNAFLVCLTPESSGETSPEKLKLIGHFEKALASDLPALRNFAVAALLLILPGEDEENFEFKFPNLNNEEFARSVLEKRATEFLHSEQSKKEKTGYSALMNSLVSKLNLISNTSPLVSSFASSASLPTWPSSKSWSRPGHSGFSFVYAIFFERIAALSRGTVVLAYRSTLERAVADVSDRGNQCAAAEVLAGFVRYHGTNFDKIWSDWIAELLKRAISNCTTESFPDWSNCLRFAASNIKPVGQLEDPKWITSLQFKILSLLIEPIGSESSSGQHAKRYQMMAIVLGEVLSNPRSAKDPVLVNIQLKILEEVKTKMSFPALQVRAQVGRLLSMLSCHWAIPNQMLPSTTDVLSEECARLADEALRKAESGEFCGEEEERWVETFLQFLLSSLKLGSFSLVSTKFPPFLAPLLFFQESSKTKSSSQSSSDLALSAKLTFAHAKYQSIKEEESVMVLEAVKLAMSSASWQVRAAGLAFVGSFGYRHSFLLEPSQAHQLADLVISLLFDPQNEVRELASVTLTGLLRGSFQGMGEEIRERCLKKIREEKKRIRKKSRAKNSDDVVKGHGLVLWLSSLIGSSPYDVPDWMPDVLLSLAEFSGEPPPIRSAVAKTFGEFKRTHADNWALHKSKFTSEQWDILSDITSSDSYFV